MIQSLLHYPGLLSVFDYYNYINVYVNTGGAGSLLVTGGLSGIGEPSSNSGLVSLFSYK